jgi:serine/threonine-protein kinase
LSASVLLSSSLFSNIEPYFDYQRSIARIFVSASAQSPAQNATGNNATMLVYQNSTYGIKMQYPSGWTVTEFNNSVAAPTKLVVGFKSPIGEQRGSDVVPETVVVGVEELASKNMGLGPYTTLQLSLLSEATQGFDLLESQPTTIANNPAHQIVYTETVGPLKLKKMQVWTIKDGKAYIAVYGADESNYSDQLPTARRILDSFEIINTAPKITNSTR